MQTRVCQLNIAVLQGLSGMRQSNMIIPMQVSMISVLLQFYPYMVAGADAAFHVLADAGRWQQAVYLATACLAFNCSQSSQLLVYSQFVTLST